MTAIETPPPIRSDFAVVVPSIDIAQSTPISLCSVLCIFAVLAIGFAIQIAHGFFHNRALAALIFAIMLIAGALAGPRITVLLPRIRHSVLRRIFVLISIGYLLLGLAILRLEHPPIDVNVFETDGVRALLHGQNPYDRATTHLDVSAPGQNFYGPGISVNGRVHVGVPYPPLTLLWILPGYLAGDIRYSFLLAILLTAYLCLRLDPGPNGFAAALLLLFVPETFFVLTMSWTEPLMLVTLAATLLSARKAPNLLPLALGAFLASKQYSLLAVPLALLLLPEFSWKQYLSLVLRSGTVAAIVNLPFAVWDARGFWWSLVTFQVAAPMRPEALSFSALLVRHGSSPIPQWFVAMAVVSAMTFVLLYARRSPSDFAASLALVSLVFFVLNKQAFCNYYFFSAGALCLSIAAGGFGSGDLFTLARLPGRNISQSPIISQ
jgi:hypothetical protein